MTKLCSLVGLILLGGLLAVGPAPASASIRPARAPAPPIAGTCRNYSLVAMRQASESSAPVPCSRRHDALVIKVGSLVPGTTWATTASTPNFMAAERQCAPALRKNPGTTWAKADMSDYALAWFAPTRAEFDAGARWLRCDVVLPGRSRMYALPHRKRFLTRTPLTRTTRSCLSSRGAAYSCAAPHTYRAVGTFRKSGRVYPSRRAFLRAARRHCIPIAGHHSYAIWPNVAKWRLGDHVVVCYRHR